MKPTSPQAHKPKTVIACGFTVVVFLSLGCVPSDASFRTQSGSSTGRHTVEAQAEVIDTIDLGIVLADRGGTFIYPLSKLGLVGIPIDGIESSCTCVTVRIVQIAGSEAGGAIVSQEALEISVGAESQFVGRAQRLAIMLKVLSGDVEIPLVIEFVSTALYSISTTSGDRFAWKMHFCSSGGSTKKASRCRTAE